MSNNIKKGLAILSLALVCVAGFAATAKPTPRPQQPAQPTQAAHQPPAPEPVAQH